MNIRDILDKKLHNNDIHIIDMILSYLDKCYMCERMDNCKKYVIRKTIPLCLPLCYECMVEMMLDDPNGRSGVVPEDEYYTRWLKYYVKN